MSEKRFQIGLTVVLLAGTAWYAVQMASYPANAGRVPLIAALIMAAVLLVQLVVQVRAAPAPQPVLAPTPPSAVEVPAGGDPLAAAERLVHEVEEATSGFDALLALDGRRGRRLLTIVVFSVLYYFVALLVGFVISTGVLITGFMLIARERAWIAVVSGLLSSAAVYALVVLVLNMPALDGYLF
ncbi:hypothetical protein [Actinotalea sp. Marseille-Q4924]|uniref:hypothetical protein n=1 Tax=Actinotalea sp. Marseille-Q4924 TaxID=2866571 RepID=UPI001CE45AD0|nr:hypothetical protein [Actinotalea sp. Marseille-Q4924]